jgi:hypothetical protein
MRETSAKRKRSRSVIMIFQSWKNLPGAQNLFLLSEIGASGYAFAEDEARTEDVLSPTGMYLRIIRYEFGEESRYVVLVGVCKNAIHRSCSTVVFIIYF